jgi:hypothetical protein
MYMQFCIEGTIRCFAAGAVTPHPSEVGCGDILPSAPVHALPESLSPLRQSLNGIE